MTRFFAGIGSRETPVEICTVFSEIAQKLTTAGVWLRSGHADGADMAFERGVVNDRKQIWLPWLKFNGSDSKLVYKEYAKEFIDQLLKKEHLLKLTDAGKRLHYRNFHQIYGNKELGEEKSEIVICWTKNGDLVGGTATALKIAKLENIPIINFGKAVNDSGVNSLINLVYDMCAVV